MTTVLSGSRPMVAIGPSGYRFTILSSRRRMSRGTVPSRKSPAPVAPEVLPHAADHVHDDDGDVIGAAVLIGLVDQKVANPLRIAQPRNGGAQRRLGHGIGETVAAEQHV